MRNGQHNTFHNSPSESIELLKREQHRNFRGKSFRPFHSKYSILNCFKVHNNIVKLTL